MPTTHTTQTAFQSAATSLPLGSCPINPGWIRDGAPRARAAKLSRSADGTTQTMVWDCTAGSFEWRYDCDETIHIVEGHIILQDHANGPTRLGPGDSVFFPKGAIVHWTVEHYVKKVAFLRRIVPNPLLRPYHALRTFKSQLRAIARRSGKAPQGQLSQGQLSLG